MNASPALVAALKASLAAPAHGWAVSAAVRYARSEVAVAGGVVSVVARQDVTVALLTTALHFPADTEIAMQVSYAATLDGAGALLAARLYIVGGQYDVTDAALHAQVMALGDAWLATQQTALTAALS